MKTIAAALIASTVMATGLTAQDKSSQNVLGPYGLDRDAYILRYRSIHAPVIGKSAMVSSQNDIATKVGVKILEDGGNAIDAAIAVGFALTVTLPRAGNIGGGGFMVIHDAEKQDATTIDYRETAPTGVTAADFLTKDGEKDRNSRFDWPAAGVPGTVAGFYKAWEMKGKLPWKRLLQPSIKLAEEGFLVSYDLSEILAIKQAWLKGNKASAKAFYKTDGSSYAPGEIMTRPALAHTLKLIAEQGPDAFYKGEIAQKIAADMKKNGGHIDLDDLANYEAIVREPVRGTYRGYDVVSMAPPSSGGIAIVEMLNILENFPISEWGYSSRSIHVLSEAMKLAFADRGRSLADPAFFKTPVKELTDKAYGRYLAGLIKEDSLLDIEHGLLEDYLAGEGPESPSTTHYSIVDAEGNAVSNTYTISSSFGSGLTVEGTGILLNNQIHTFSVRAGIKGATGFIASEANKVEPGKRPISSQSPTMVLKDGKPVLVVGSPGGSRIINAVVQMIINVIDHNMNIADATHTPRIHHQWVPNVLEVEPGFNLDTIAALKARGHDVKVTFTMGSTQSIHVTPNYIFGSSDPRRPNALTIGLD
ncbi:gamma-glutamyltransferase [Kordiimonas sp. SCSIO 12610]|uniref:gamma-glutamyltransferase n=1 Tax=Kordiimonas sp. SCSIO 12610 TaxID=2829597 RepID=UPI00210C2554|nr:gamma-glutamyltransferase [Kordiimonas sp. SCSIO 12610]UTW54598.1 gamma-glutamyltransferase [Kordiimonas sp. SCSIO 12610]